MDPLAGPDTNGIVVPRVVKRPALSPAYKVTTVDVFSNHYNFTLGNNNYAYQWDVKFEPEVPVDSRELKREIINVCRKFIISKIGPFIQSADVLYSFMAPKQELLLTGDEHPKYQLRLHLVKKYLDLECLYYDGLNKQEVIKIYNSALKQMIRGLKYVQLGYRKPLFYDTKLDQTLEVADREFKLDIKSGYFAHFDVYVDKKPLLMIECSSKIVRSYSLWEEYIYFKNDQNKTHEEILDNYICGKIFMADYGNQKTYRIAGVDMDKTPQSDFPNSQYKDYIDYYKKRYGLKILEMKQFLVYSIEHIKSVNANGKVESREQKVFLIPELLKPTGLIEEIRQDKKSMRELSKYTKLSPTERRQREVKLIKQINSLSEGSNELKIKIDPDSNGLKSLVINPPTILLGNSKSVIPNRGNFEVKEPIFDVSACLKEWIVISRDEDREKCEEFVKKINHSSKLLGIKVDKPIHKGLSSQNQTGKAIVALLDSQLGKTAFLLFLPKRLTDRVYKVVKCHANGKQGVVTQFFTNFQKSTELSVASKVLQQIVAKLGMKLWKVSRPVGTENMRIMSIGADVFHKDLHQSVSTVVSTLDKDFSSWFSQTSIQKRKGDDVLIDISEKIRKAAREYIDKNHNAPQVIIVYRDGVDDGMLDVVRETEVRPLLKGLSEEFGENKFSLLYFVINKRIGERFYEINHSGELVNPRSGTFIFEKVTKTDSFDFFMVGPSVKPELGSARPVYFNALYNNTNLKLETIIELTNYQCYTYYNWQGTLKVPAVCMLAQKLGVLNGQTTIGPRVKIADKAPLSDKPYYI
jgi:aubergine-like protein